VSVLGRYAGCLTLAILSAGCAEEAAPDPRFATPNATVRTLLHAYGLSGLSQQDIQKRMRDHRRFELLDELAYRACFEDFDSADDEGLAGFVVGAIAAGRDSLRVTIVQGTASVFPSPQARIVLHRHDDGWKISLRESVPGEVQRELRAITQRAAERARRLGRAE